MRFYLVCFLALSSISTRAQVQSEILAVDLLLKPLETAQVSEDPMAEFLAADSMDFTVDVSVSLAAGVDSVFVQFGSATGATDYGTHDFASSDCELFDNETPTFMAIALRYALGVRMFESPFHVRAVLKYTDGGVSAPFDTIIQ